jgi:hypothetical protein
MYGVAVCHMFVILVPMKVRKCNETGVLFGWI